LGGVFSINRWIEIYLEQYLLNLTQINDVPIILNCISIKIENTINESSTINDCHLQHWPRWAHRANNEANVVPSFAVTDLSPHLRGNESY